MANLFTQPEWIEGKGRPVNVYALCGRAAVKEEAGRGSGRRGRTKPRYVRSHGDSDKYAG